MPNFLALIAFIKPYKYNKYNSGKTASTGVLGGMKVYWWNKKSHPKTKGHTHKLL